MSEEEKIRMCLNCSKSYCDNCLGSVQDGVKKTRKMYEWNGKEYNVKELAEIKGFGYHKMRYRIKKGGVDFAMSDFKTKSEYDIARK